jgi:hypothetical protein
MVNEFCKYRANDDSLHQNTIIRYVCIFINLYRKFGNLLADKFLVSHMVE